MARSNLHERFLDPVGSAIMKAILPMFDSSNVRMFQIAQTNSMKLIIPLLSVEHVPKC